MDQVAFSFGFGKAAGSNNAAAGAVRFKGAGHRIGLGQPKHGLQHFDDVFDRVIFVVENNDVIERLRLS